MIYLLHNIGNLKNINYNTREQILNTSKDDILTFDGVYQNIYNNRDILKNKKVILFIVGSYIGLDNRWDIKMPLENFCTIDELLELKAMGCSLGFHSWSHRNLTKLSDEEIYEECIPPSFIGKEFFAYPYGKLNNIVINIIKKIGYKEAFSVNRGDNSQYQKLRKYLK